MQMRSLRMLKCNLRIFMRNLRFKNPTSRKVKV